MNNPSSFAIVVFSSLLVLASIFGVNPEVKAAEQVMFEDTFENYSTGSFPYGGGWDLWFTGAGKEK